MKRSTLDTTIYHLARLSPAMVFPLFGSFPTYSDREVVSLFVSRLVTVVIALLVWNMAEGAMMLWYRANTERRQDARKYLFVTGLLGFVLLGVLQIFRSRSTQGLFIILLAVLSLRGMSRSGWEQGRCRIAFAASMLNCSLLGVLSFLLFTDLGQSGGDIGTILYLPWQAFAIAVALGSAVAAVETTWYSGDAYIDSVARWQVPAYRLAIFIGPIITATLALTGNLPLCYLAIYLVIPFAARLSKQVSQRGFLSNADFRPTAKVYGLFIAVIIACRAYEHGWFV